jgi:ABC-2 type transport system permease protein
MSSLIRDEAQLASVRTRSNTASALTAFLAIMARDLVVLRREFISFLLQSLVQPLFFLFIFGRVLTGIGLAQASFTLVLLPGIVAFTIVMTSLQAVTIPLVAELGWTREIDDRLLAPLPVSLVAIEKVLFASARGLVAGVVIFPLAWWILGSGYQVRGDVLGLLIILMVFTSLMGASLGLVLGTAVPPTQISLMFSLVLTPLLFTGCAYNPWATLAGIRWFQIVTLFNPLTYASEGLRAVMIPPPFPTLALGWSFLGLGVGTIAFC